MAIVIVGGHSRNVGKTSVMAGLIRGMPERRWTAIKITQFGHGLCSADGKPCDCETADHTMAISEERDRHSGTDSSRYLEAGAARSLWVRTRQGHLAEAMPRIRKELEAAGDAVVESNSLLRFFQPTVYVTVVDATQPDFKESARRYLDRADACVVTGGRLDDPAWTGVSSRLLARAVKFAGEPNHYCSEALIAFVRGRLGRE